MMEKSRMRAAFRSPSVGVAPRIVGRDRQARMAPGVQPPRQAGIQQGAGEVLHAVRLQTQVGGRFDDREISHGIHPVNK